MGRNVVSQSGCRIFKSTISPKRSAEIALIKALTKTFWMGMVKNGCDESGHGPLKLSKSEE